MNAPVGGLSCATVQVLDTTVVARHGEELRYLAHQGWAALADLQVRIVRQSPRMPTLPPLANRPRVGQLPTEPIHTQFWGVPLTIELEWTTGGGWLKVVRRGVAAAARLWTEATTAVDNKLSSALQSDLTDHDSPAEPCEELLVLLACGSASPGLRHFLCSTLCENGARRLAKASAPLLPLALAARVGFAHEVSKVAAAVGVLGAMNESHVERLKLMSRDAQRSSPVSFLSWENTNKGVEGAHGSTW